MNNETRAVASISGATPIVLRIVACGVLFDALIPLSPFIVESFGIGFGDFQRILSMGFLIFAGTQFLAPRFANAGEPEQLLILLLMFSANAVGSVSACTSLRGFDGAVSAAINTGSTRKNGGA
ncbi:hypothetical protein [Variovorax sp. J31P207]|uniref:hypothetical protein n=1 Tax=Variovorax sp. J31P207 TaxID=3053510 RepID=UPI002575309C|nr:hypothetical protein [Variovorax sp. J31P207]MDM0071343.1 hypothetical protein [Variovorax sp. J31P207]